MEDRRVPGDSDHGEAVTVELTTITYEIGEDGVTEVGREVTHTATIPASPLD